MDKYIGFDIDSKKTVACVVQKGQNDRFTTLKTDIEQMKKFLRSQRRPGEKLHLTFEISGEDRLVKKAFAGGLRDGLFRSAATEVIVPDRSEIASNPRSSSAKFRWACLPP